MQLTFADWLYNKADSIELKCLTNYNYNDMNKALELRIASMYFQFQCQ